MRYALSDGLLDIEFGLALALWGGLCLLGRSVSAAPAYWAAAGVMSGSCIFWAPWLSEKLRTLIVYPRGGYVAFEPLFSPRLRTLFKCIEATAIAGIVMLSAMMETERVVVPAMVVLGLPQFFLSLKKRWTALLGAVLCLGIGWLMYRDKEIYSDSFWFLAVFGVTDIVRGLWRLRKFLEAHPKREAGTI